MVQIIMFDNNIWADANIVDVEKVRRQTLILITVYALV